MIKGISIFPTKYSNKVSGAYIGAVFGGGTIAPTLSAPGPTLNAQPPAVLGGAL